MSATDQNIGRVMWWISSELDGTAKWGIVRDVLGDAVTLLPNNDIVEWPDLHESESAAWKARLNSLFWQEQMLQIGVELGLAPGSSSSVLAEVRIKLAKAQLMAKDM